MSASSPTTDAAAEPSQSRSSRRLDQLEDSDQLPVEMQPTFTVQDERNERMSMSIDDVYKVQSDLTGITLNMSALGVTKNSTPASPAAPASEGSASAGEQPGCVRPVPRSQEQTAILRRLDDELAKLPSRLTVVHREARTHHPHLVNDEVKMQFVDCEEGDIALAAVRLARHWEARFDVFGSDRCFLPVTAEGAMRGEIEPMLRQGINAVLPVTDAAGRAIIFIDLSKRNFDVYSFVQEIRAMFYLAQCLAENDETRKRGLVFLIDGRNLQRSQYTRRMSMMSHVMFECMPIPCRAFHVFPNWLINNVLSPVIKHFLPKGLRLRLKFHNSTGDAVLRELESFNLPKSCLPVQLGGDVIINNMGQWVAERTALETVRNVYMLSDTAAPPAKKACTGTSEANPTKTRAGEMSSLSAKVGSNPSAARNVKKRKGRRFGRKSDPRMAKAVEVKAANEDLSLHGALVAGGYVFRHDPKTLGEVDEDGVSLRQVSWGWNAY
jgi:hypothetical protein